MQLKTYSQWSIFTKTFRKLKAGMYDVINIPQGYRVNNYIFKGVKLQIKNKQIFHVPDNPTLKELFLWILSWALLSINFARELITSASLAQTLTSTGAMFTLW